MNLKLNMLHSALVLCIATGMTASAQQANPLALAVRTLGSENLSALHYSGSGSSYSFGLDADGNEVREYARVMSFLGDVDYTDRSAHTEVTLRVEDDERTEDRTVLPDAPWEAAIDFWLDPHVFLREAVSREAHTETVHDLGVDYTVVTFEASAGHTLAGYIDSDNVLRKVRTTFDDPVLGDRMVEMTYRSWEDFDGIRFPTLMIRKENRSPTLILVVREVEYEG